jgi:hypothetical protein
MLPLPPLLPPLFIRPFQIALGVAIGWMLREQRERDRKSVTGAS